MAVVLVGVAGLALGGCAPDGAILDDQGGAAAWGAGVESNAHPVVGGTVAGTCSVPMNVKIPGCTATLLTSTILVTAKHCRPKAGMLVEFGEKAPFAFSVRAVKCVSATNSDSAYCTLPVDERLKAVPTVPVLHGCEYNKFLKPGVKILGVGFGQTKGTGPARTKALVEVPVVRVRDPSIAVGDQKGDLCFGDSGGGAFVRLLEGDKDWGYRLIGTVTGTAGGVMAPCGGTGYTSILRHIKLIEDNEMIDITPCTDAQGAWAPGPECKDFLTDIKTGGGAWPACSSGPRTTGPIDSCGGGPGPTIPPPSSGTDAAVMDTARASDASKPDAVRVDTGSGASGGASGGGASGGASGGGASGGASGGGTASGGATGAGSGGSTGRADAAVDSKGGLGGTPGTTPGPDPAGGCGCDLGAAQSNVPAGAPLVALLGLALLRRRRK